MPYSPPWPGGAPLTAVDRVEAVAEELGNEASAAAHVAEEPCLLNFEKVFDSCVLRFYFLIFNCQIRRLLLFHSNVVCRMLCSTQQCDCDLAVVETKSTHIKQLKVPSEMLQSRFEFRTATSRQK